jgi:hypothetical protein
MFSLRTGLLLSCPLARACFAVVKKREHFVLEKLLRMVLLTMFTHRDH